MDQYLKTLAKIVLTSACAALPLTLAGCEKDEARADRRVKEALAQSSQLSGRGKTAADAAKNQKEAVKLLGDAAKESAAGSASQAAAKGLLAEANYAQALSMLPQLSDNENQARALIAQIERLGVGVGGDNRLVAQFAGANPAGKGDVAPLKAFEKNKAEATAKLADTDKLIAQTQTELDAKTGIVKDLEAKRSTQAQQAAGLLEQSEKTTGQASVDLFNQHLVSRKSAADIARDRAIAELAVAGLKTKVAEAQKQKAIQQDAITKAQVQIDKLNTGWTETQKSMAERRAASKAMVEEAKLEGKDGIVEQLTRLLGAADDIRKEVAEKYLETTINNYSAARSAAAKFDQELKSQLNNPAIAQLPAKLALDKTRKSNSPVPYALARARTLQLRGNLYLNQKLLLDSLQQVVNGITPAFEAAGLKVPAELKKLSSPAAVAEAAKKAKQELEVADEDYKEWVQADNPNLVSPTEKTEASVAHVATLYSLYRLSGDPKRLSEAKEQLKAMADSGVVLPRLPSDLEDRAGVTLNVPAAGTTDVEKPAAPTAAPAGALGGLLKKAGEALKGAPPAGQ